MASKKKQLEVVVDLDLNEVLSAVPSARTTGAYNKFIIEANAETLRLSLQGATKAELNQALSLTMQKHYNEIKEYFYENIVKGKDFSVLAADDSFGLSVKQRVNTSVRRVLKEYRGYANNAHTQFKKIDKTLTAAQQNALAKKYIKNYVNGVSSSMGFNSSRLINSETRAYEQRQSDAKHEGEGCYWELGDTETHCPECVGLAGTYYKTPSDAPSRPRHNKCDCNLVYVGESTKEEIKELKRDARAAKRDLR